MKLARCNGGWWVSPTLRSCFLATLLAAGGASAQAYPNKPIRLVTAEAGGGNDLQARLVAQGVSMRIGQRIVVDNRPSGVIPGDIVAKAAPDGYTLLLYNNTLWIGALMQKTPYDVFRDLTPVVWVSAAPNILVVNPALPVKSVPELIALARAKPGVLNYASSGTGSSSHLAGALFNAMAGVDIVRVAYKGAALGMTDLMGGRVQVMYPTSVAASTFVKSGKVRALAVTSAEPSPLAPGLPTVASAAGLPGYESVSIYGVFAPAKTPRAIVMRLNEEMAAVLTAPDQKEKLVGIGMEPVGGPPERLARTMKSEIQRLGKVIKASGLGVE